MSQQNNQNQANNQEDDKVFARHVTVRDTKTGGSILTMFIGVEEAARIVSDLQTALDMSAKGESEGATISVVTGEGKNGKPYALIGARPLYPRKDDGQGAQQAPQQAAAQNKGGYQPRNQGGYNKPQGNTPAKSGFTPRKLG